MHGIATTNTCWKIKLSGLINLLPTIFFWRKNRNLKPRVRIDRCYITYSSWNRRCSKFLICFTSKELLISKLSQNIFLRFKCLPALAGPRATVIKKITVTSSCRKYMKLMNACIVESLLSRPIGSKRNCWKGTPDSWDPRITQNIESKRGSNVFVRSFLDIKLWKVQVACWFY